MINYFLIGKLQILQIFLVIKFNLYNKKMNSLKSAFGKEQKVSDKIFSNISNSIKKFSKSKSQSMWALQNQDKNQDTSLDNDKKLSLLSNLLKAAYDKDPNITNITFDRIVQDFQDQLGNSTIKSQISSLLVLQDKLTDLIDLYTKAKPQFSVFIQNFHEKVQQKIALLRCKDKSKDLNDYESIIKKNFKKKTDFLDVGGIKVQLSVKSRQKSHNKKNSNQKKLNRLFSKDKQFKQKEFKKQQDHDDYLLSQTMGQKNQSISYSAIMSTSVAVKQRRPRKKSGQYQDHYANKTQSKQIKTVQNQQQGQKTDKAFIFYRPKKGKKN